MPALASERGPPSNVMAPTPIIVVDVSNITGGDQAIVKRTWRDNFGEDLLIKPKEAVRKTPGELLLERHLIKLESDRRKEAKAAADKDDDLDDDAMDPMEEMMAMARRRKNSDSNKIRRPSFHDICQEISSDKIESVDDLNAGELRRRASLLPDVDGDDDQDELDDEENDAGDEAENDLEGDREAAVPAPPVQQSNGHSPVNSHSNNIGGDTHITSPSIQAAVPSTALGTVSGGGGQRAVNKITKSASGTLHCLLERHLHNNNSTNGESTTATGAGSRRKSVKRVHHKITAKVHIDAQSSSHPSDPVVLRQQQLNATVEHVSEEHLVHHVVSLPGKKKAPIKEALPKKISRAKGTSNQESGEQDFWGILGPRETIYLNNRRQNIIERQLKRLQTCTEDSEEVQQFQESVLSELPQSPTVEQRQNFSKPPFDDDVLKQVQTKKKVLVAAAPSKLVAAAAKQPTVDEEQSLTKTAIAEKSERSEQKNLNGPKIAPAKIKTTTTTTTKATRDSDAKSPASERQVIDSSHEEVVGENRNKQTPKPVSSITTPSISVASSSSADGPTTPTTVAASTTSDVCASVQESAEVALPKKKKLVIAKKTTTNNNIAEGATPTTAKKVITKRTKLQIKEEEESVSGDSSLTSSVSPAVTKPKVTTKLGKSKITTTATQLAVQRESPSGGSGNSSSRLSSTTSTLSSVAAALTTTSKTESADAAAHQCTPAEDQSIPGSLSKFPTIDQLHLLSSVDSDQPPTIDDMAIEISVSRAHKTDPATAKATAAPAAANTTASATTPTSTNYSSSLASAPVSGTNSADGMDPSPSLSPSSSTGVKKKRVVRKVIKRIRASPAEKSNSNVDIGIWSVTHDHNGDPIEMVIGQDINIDDSLPAEVPKETIQELIRRVKGKDKKKVSPKFDPQKCQKFSPDTKVKLFTVDEKAPKVLWATPRPLQKQPKKQYSSSETSSEETSDAEETPVSSSEAEEAAAEVVVVPPAEPPLPPQPEDMTLNLYGYKDERLSSTCSNDSGFEGGTAPSSPKNMLGE